MNLKARVIACAALLTLLISAASGLGVVSFTGARHYVAADTYQLYEGYTCDVEVDTSAELLSALAATTTSGVVICLESDVTYSGTATETRWVPVFAPATSGSALTPIVIVSKYSAARYPNNPELWSSFELANPSGNGAVLGTLTGTDYIRWIGMHIDQTMAPAAGSWGTTSTNDGVGIYYERMLVEVADAGAHDDNYNALFMQYAVDPVVRNNKYRMADGESPDFNNPVIETYASTNVTIEFNEFDGIQIAGYIKGSIEGTHNTGVIRKNITRNSAKFAWMIGEVDGTEGFDLHDNLSIGDEVFLQEVSAGGGPRQNIDVYKNTIIDFIDTIIYAKTPGSTYDNNSFRDNVVAAILTNPNSLYSFEVPGHAIFETVNYNLIYRTSGNWTIYNGAGTYSSYGAWQSGSSKDTNSTTSAPTFVNAGAEDYRLASDTSSSTGGSRGYTGSIGNQP